MTAPAARTDIAISFNWNRMSPGGFRLLFKNAMRIQSVKLMAMPVTEPGGILPEVRDPRHYGGSSLALWGHASIINGYTKILAAGVSEARSDQWVAAP